jgi:dihydrofolate synthase/folylpolyglutamate synthase
MARNQLARIAEASDWTFSPDPAAEEAIRGVFERHPPLYPDGLERLRRFLEKLGNPHKKLPFIFHAAGTNGKGSTLAFVQAVFEAAGLRVHKYTSPHLIRFEERIVVSGEPIAPALLLELIGECEHAAEGEKVSFFEFFTALAFLAFSRCPAEAVLLETGLGGLYDATNVVEGELVSLLTEISHDHMNILGATLPEIAAHKAGIIKPQAPCAVAAQESAVADVFLRRAAELEAPVRLCGRDWDVKPQENGFTYKSFTLPLPQLQGRHQIDNAGLALAALEASPFAPLMRQSVLEEAMRRVSWPGRLQKITSGPLAALLPPGGELWLDGAHNDSAAAALAEQAKRWNDGLPLHLITAMKKTKDVSGFYSPLLPHAASVQAVSTGWIEAPMLSAEALCADILSMGYGHVKTAATIESALRALAAEGPAPQRVLVTGSLYLVGHALRLSL